MAKFAEVEVAAAVAIGCFACKKGRNVAEVTVAVFAYSVGFAQTMAHWTLSLCAWKRPALATIYHNIVS